MLGSDSAYKDSVRTAKPNVPRDVKSRVALLLERIIFYGLLTLVALTAIIPLRGLEPWWARSFECAIFVLAALWIMEGLLSGGWGVRGRSMLLPLLAVTIFAFAQTLPLWSFGSESIGVDGVAWKTLSIDPYGTRLVVLKLLAYVIFFTLLLRYTYSKYRLKVLLCVVIGIGLASALFGLARQGMGQTTGFVLPYLRVGKGYGQFDYHNAFASVMVMCVGLVLGLVIRGGVRRERVLIYLAIGLPLWTAVVLSNSRGGILSMISQMPFLAILYGAARPSRDYLEEGGRAGTWFVRATGSMIARAALVLGLIVTLAISALWLGGDSLVNKLGRDEILGEDEIIAGSGLRGLRRIDVWRETWPLVRANPVTGVGFGAYWVAIDRYLNTSGKLKPYEAHNDYLDLLASGGLIGVALAGWFVFAVLRRTRRQFGSSDNFRRAACAGALVGLFGVAIHSLFDFTLQISLNSLIFVVLIVIATAEISDGRTKAERKGRRGIKADLE
jgi:O-antigen ligase